MKYLLATLVLATRNAGKIREFNQLLAELPIRLRPIDEFASVPEIEETGATFSENALIKARTAAQAVGFDALGEDSGLEVDALGGVPGVWSARYGGPGLDDAGRCRLLLEEMAGVPADQRGARYRAVIAVVTRGGGQHFFEGTVAGRIGREARGAGGFGYDPIFYPQRCAGGEAADRSMAELTPVEKNAISHRARALQQLRLALSEGRLDLTPGRR
ncbi:MAG: RdgB/HAM1 family non-canonical purine NTP pyrophosphatase [Thermaerobacterales bacterium]